MTLKSFSLQSKFFQYQRQQNSRQINRKTQLITPSYRQQPNRRKNDDTHNPTNNNKFGFDDEFSQYFEERLFGTPQTANKTNKNQQKEENPEQEPAEWEKKIAELKIPTKWENQKQKFMDILYDQGYVTERRSLHIHYYALKKAALSFAENNIQYIDAIPAKLIVNIILSYQEQQPPYTIAKSLSRLQGVYTKTQYIGVLKNSKYVFVDLMRLIVLFMEEREEVMERTSPGLVNALENLMPVLLPLMLMPPEVVDQKIKQNTDKARSRNQQISQAHYRKIQEFEEQAMKITRARFGDDGLKTMKKRSFNATDSLLNDKRVKLKGKGLGADEVFDWDENRRQNGRDSSKNQVEMKQDWFSLDMPITPKFDNRESKSFQEDQTPNKNHFLRNGKQKRSQNKNQQPQQIIFNDFYNQYKQNQQQQLNQNTKQQNNVKKETMETFWKILEGQQINSDENLTKKHQNNKQKSTEILHQWDLWEDKQLPNNQYHQKYQNYPRIQRFQNQYNQQLRTNFPLDDWERQSKFENQDDNDDDYDSDDDSGIQSVRILNRNPEQIENLQKKKQQYYKEKRIKQNKKRRGQKQNNQQQDNI